MNRYEYVVGNPETLTDATGQWPWDNVVKAVTNVVAAVAPAVAAVVQAAAPVVGAVVNATLGISDMVNDVKTIFNPNASWQDTFGSIVNLGFNVFMDATTVIGVGEGLKALEIGGKLAADVGEQAVKDGAEKVLEDGGEAAARDGTEQGAKQVGRRISATLGDEGHETFNIVREVGTEEDFTGGDLLDELKSRTYESGREHAIVDLQDGRRVLIEGGPRGIDDPAAQIKQLLIHTHPYDLPPTGPSKDDIDFITRLGQSSSWLLEHGQLTQFFPK
jgi:hypothetical protein